MSAAMANAGTWTDINGLQSITALGRSDRAASLRAAARQFESFFVSQLLQGMRAANAVLAEDSPFGSQEMQFRQDLLDRQLSVSLTQGRGIGIADLLARQLQRQFAAATPAAASERPAGEATAQLQERRVKASAVARGLTLPVVVDKALQRLEPVVKKMHRRVAEGLFAGKEAFVRSLLPEARRAAQALGVDHRVLLAQSALETGWGRSILADHAGRSSNNLFNIKAGSFWQGPSVGVSTLEFVHGLPQQQHARFRAYASFAESMDDYVGLLRTQPRYAAALENAGDSARFIHSLADAGYATDPEYARKVLDLLRDETITGAR